MSHRSSNNSNGFKDPRENKVSSLTDSMAFPAETPAAGGKDVLQDSQTYNKRKWLAVLMDVILFVAFVGLVVGGWFGYNALRDVYAPLWESRSMILIVELPCVDPALIPALGNPDERSVYNTEKTGVPALGQVMDMTVTDPIGDDFEDDVNGDASADEDYEGVENDQVYKTVRLIISAQAKYQKDKGYYVNSSPILAGDVNLYRFKGMAAEGTILALYEKDEYESMNEADSETVAASTTSN